MTKIQINVNDKKQSNEINLNLVLLSKTNEWEFFWLWKTVQYNDKWEFHYWKLNFPKSEQGNLQDKNIKEKIEKNWLL